MDRDEVNPQLVTLFSQTLTAASISEAGILIPVLIFTKNHKISITQTPNSTNYSCMNLPRRHHLIVGTFSAGLGGS
jgi:hypothetical protein